MTFLEALLKLQAAGCTKISTSEDDWGMAEYIEHIEAFLYDEDFAETYSVRNNAVYNNNVIEVQGLI